MQFGRLISFLLVTLSFGLLAAASPVAGRTELAARTGSNDAAVLAAGQALYTKVEADLAIIVELLAGVDLDVAVFADIFATLTADIKVAVDVVVALPGAYVGVDIDVIAEVYANVLLAIFPVLQKAEVVAGLSGAYYSLLEVQINALLAGLNVAVYGVVSVIGGLTVGLQVLLVGQLDIFVNILGILGIGIIISL